MMIPVLTELENRQQWLEFLRRERPYAQLKTPSCRVDLQSTYLQITLLSSNNGSPLRYTLGSRNSIEPVWQLISRCNWSLTEITDGLESMAFTGNARDSKNADWDSDLSVRRSVPREPGLITEQSLGVFKKPDKSQTTLDIEGLIAYLAWNRAELDSDRWTAGALISAIRLIPGDWTIEQLSPSVIRLHHNEDLPIEITLRR